MEPLPVQRGNVEDGIASAAHSGRKEGFPGPARAVTLEQASGIPGTKGAAPQLRGISSRLEMEIISPRADDAREIICIGLSLFLLPQPLQRLGPGAGNAGPDRKGRPEAAAAERLTAEGATSLQRAGRVRASRDPAALLGCGVPPRGWTRRSPRRAVWRGAAQSPCWEQPARDGSGAAGRRFRGARRGRAGGGAPAVGGAGGVGVNVRPAPAALTQFHQKPEEEVAEPQRSRHRGGSGGQSRAGSRDRNLGRPGPTPLTCAGNPGPGAPGGDGAGSEHVWPFVRRGCVCPGT